MENKHEIINYFISKIGYTTYLELGIGSKKETFSEIKCSYKTGVDSTVGGEDIINVTTDEFFKMNKKKYDVIYIDADHDVESVYKDYLNAAKYLKKGGIIFMHDIGTVSLRNTSPAASGTAYKAWIRICAECCRPYYLKDMDTLYS